MKFTSTHTGGEDMKINFPWKTKKGSKKKTSLDKESDEYLNKILQQMDRKYINLNKLLENGSNK